MPTYEYQCLKCGYKFEKFQKITDKPIKNCPKCKNKVRKIISTGAGIIFKGSGFYATDYKKAKQRLTDKEKSDQVCPKDTTKSPASHSSPTKPSEDK